MQVVPPYETALIPVREAPNGPITTEGNKSAKATKPSTAPDSLSSQASQPTPIRCIQVPISEMLLPAT